MAYNASLPTFDAGTPLQAADMDILTGNIAALAAGAAGVKSHFIKAKDFDIAVGSVALGLQGSGGNGLRQQVYAFDAASDEEIVTTFYCEDFLPSAGVVTARIYWAPATTNTGQVNWQIFTTDISSGEQIDQAADETDNVNQSGSGTAENLHITSPVTIARTGRLWRIQVRRDADAAGDTFTGDAWFLGLLLEFTPS